MVADSLFKEWVHGLRSSLHPAIFALGYLIVESVIGTSTKLKAQCLVAAPKVMQAGFAALGDWYTWRLAGKLYGQDTPVTWSVVSVFYLGSCIFYLLEVNLKMGWLDSDDPAQPLAVVHFNKDILKLLHAPAKPNYPVIAPNDLVNYDAFLFGIPTRYGNFPGQWKVCDISSFHPHTVWFYFFFVQST